MPMKFTLKTGVISCVFLVVLFGGNSAQSDLSKPLRSKPGFDMKIVERGRYLVRITGCNDCHTAGYLLSDGKVDEELWLTGDTFGWRGPWGTTYGSNLRLPINGFTEAQWVDMAKTLRRRPTMPWFSLNDMKEEDLRAIYQFIRYLGPRGKPAPIYVPPDQEPSGPHATFPAPPK
jgi:hypothetical protein